MKETLHVNLSQIPSYVITLEGTPARQKHMRQVFEQLGIKNYRFKKGIKADPNYIGIALSHLRAIRTGLKNGIPFAVYEDDCTATKHFTPALTISNDVHAIHLGASRFGMIENYSRSNSVKDAVLADCWSEGFLRIFNMVSMHAVVYLSADFCHAMRRSIVECLVSEIPCDSAFGLLQRYFTIIAPEKPFFYQDSEFGGQEWQTHFELSVPSLRSQIGFGTPKGPRHYQVGQHANQPIWQPISNRRTTENS